MPWKKDKISLEFTVKKSFSNYLVVQYTLGSDDFLQTSRGFGWDTPWKINMEPTNHPFRKENDLNQNLHEDMFQPLIFQGVCYGCIAWRFVNLNCWVFVSDIFLDPDVLAPRCYVLLCRMAAAKMWSSLKGNPAIPSRRWFQIICYFHS